MLTKILLGIILTLSLACGSLYLMLDSKSKSLDISELSVKTLRESLEKSSEELQKAQSLRKKHEEIIAELFLDQDTTKEKFDDLEARFSGLEVIGLKGKSCKPLLAQRAITNVEKMLLSSLIFLSISGCSQKQLVLQETVVLAPPQHLLSDCGFSDVGELGDSYESAFYSVSSSYIKSAKKVAECNNRLKAARKFIEEANQLYDDKESAK